MLPLSKAVFACKVTVCAAGKACGGVCPSDGQRWLCCTIRSTFGRCLWGSCTFFPSLHQRGYCTALQSAGRLSTLCVILDSRGLALPQNVRCSGGVLKRPRWVLIPFLLVRLGPSRGPWHACWCLIDGVGQPWAADRQVWVPPFPRRRQYPRPKARPGWLPGEALEAA